jgi:hypothetical protein
MVKKAHEKKKNDAKSNGNGNLERSEQVAHAAQVCLRCNFSIPVATLYSAPSFDLNDVMCGATAKKSPAER